LKIKNVLIIKLVYGALLSAVFNKTQAFVVSRPGIINCDDTLFSSALYNQRQFKRLAIKLEQ
jgi:hypothetical protein